MSYTVNQPSARLKATAPPTLANRLARYLPLITWIGIIFFASSSQMSASETSRVIGPLLRWLFPDVSSETFGLIHFGVRKSAHFVVYALLALIAARAFITSSQTFLRRHWLFCSFAVVAVCALLDEYNQSLTASRTGSIYDSLLDMTGGLTALGILALWRMMSSKCSRAL